jgi:hypothetical protein
MVHRNLARLGSIIAVNVLQVTFLPSPVQATLIYIYGCISSFHAQFFSSNVIYCQSLGASWLWQRMGHQTGRWFLLLKDTILPSAPAPSNGQEFVSCIVNDVLSFLLLRWMSYL